MGMAGPDGVEHFLSPVCRGLRRDERVSGVRRVGQAFVPLRLARRDAFGRRGAFAMRLDRDDIMGNQIKSIRPAEKVQDRKINGLSAKIFTGTASLANIKMSFLAAVVRDNGPSFVVFCVPANNAHLEKMIASINSIRGPKSGK